MALIKLQMERVRSIYCKTGKQIFCAFSIWNLKNGMKTFASELSQKKEFDCSKKRASAYFRALCIAEKSSNQYFARA